MDKMQYTMDQAMIMEPPPDDGTEMIGDISIGPDYDPSLIPTDDDGWDEEPETGYSTQVHEDFLSNLAETMPEGKRGFLAQTIIKWVDQDKNSRKDWAVREAAGIVALGVTGQVVGGLAGLMPTTGIGSDVTHPGLAQAQINFWARAYGELWQSGRPIKSVVLGNTSQELEAQGARVENFLNYLYSTEMTGAAEEFSRMLYWLPISGSKFRKPFFDPIEGAVTVETIATADFVKPYSAHSLRKASRYTHIVRMSRNNLRRMIAKGYYLDDVLNRPDESGDRDITTEILDSAVGQTPEQESGEHEAEFDQRDVLYECYCYLDLADYDAPDIESEGWGLPYVVVVHKKDQKVLSIQRNWRQTDLRKRRRLSVIEYKFLPGEGYGYGLLHVAGGLAMAQTGFLRFLLDACEMDVTGRFSGFISQDIVGMAESPTLEWGKLKKIPASGSDIKNAIWTPDYKWSATNIAEILKYLDALMGEIVSSTQSMVGEDVKNIPVGTILAIIEQKTKPFVTIFSLLHASFKEELKAVSELVADYLPPRYPYAISGANQEVMATDFDDEVDVVPSSDPNVVTALARNAQAQAIVELVKGDPEVFGPHERMLAYRRFLDVLRVQDADDLFPAEGQPMPAEMANQDTESARRDAETSVKVESAQAEIARKDAETQSRIARDAAKMESDMLLQNQGSGAIVKTDQENELARMEMEILAAARERQMGGTM